MPCISAFVTIKKEMGSTKWAIASAVLQLLTAYTVTLIVYNVGSLFL
jgi:ferrous iron transport protein B